MYPKIKQGFDKEEIVATLIMEQTMEPSKPKVLHVENSPGVNFVRFRACLQDFDVFNRNNRKYMLQPMIESWKAPHIQELIARGDMFGECGHPISKDPMRVVTIDPKLCCHRIVGIEFVGKALYGTVETLNDDMYGKQFMQHILQGCTAAFSLRALAPLTKIDATRCVIKQKCHIVTEDRVILPSHKNAYQDLQAPLEIVKKMAVAESGVIPSLNALGNTNEENVNISIPVTESSGLINYLLEESHTLKEIVDHFEVGYESAYLTDDNKSVVLTEAADFTGNKRMFKVDLEAYLDQEVTNILAGW